jgi:type IV secretory pathway component VirB8
MTIKNKDSKAYKSIAIIMLFITTAAAITLVCLTLIILQEQKLFSAKYEEKL